MSLGFGGYFGFWFRLGLMNASRVLVVLVVVVICVLAETCVLVHVVKL